MKFIKENLIMIIFILTSLLNSFILLNMTSGVNSIRFLLCDFLVLLFISSFSFLLKNKKMYFLIFSIICTSICVINSLFYNEYNDFVSIYLFETFFQALKLPSEAITNVFEMKDFVFIIQVIIMLLVIIFYKENSNKSLIKFRNTFITCGIILVAILLSFNENDIYRYKNTWNKEYQVKNFGVYSYQIRDIKNTFMKIFFNDLGKGKRQKIVEEYFNNKSTNSTNEYTNIFKDKNVILIHAESIQSMFIDEVIEGKKIMPNLSKLAKEGLNFTNFYSTEGVATSSDAEFTLNNSILPVSFGTVFLNYENNNYKSSIEILNDMDYYTFSMHGNTCEYWNRVNMYKSFGYDKFYCYTDYDLSDKIGLGLSDKSFFSQSIDMLKQISMEHDKFYGTLIMLTNHTPFYNEGKVDFNVGELEGSIIGDYIKLLNYVDEAIGDFITGLEQSDILDETVIVIYGDHDAKLKKEEYQKYFRYLNNDDSDIDFYEYEDLTKVPFIIWTKDGINKEVETITSTLDVMPTLANMLGFETKYTLGQDVFSVSDNIVVFPNGNFRTDKIYYNAQNSEYKKYEEVSDEYINEKLKYANKIVEISNYLVKYNLIED